MSYKFRNFYIPDYMMGGLQRYILQGVRPGSFLMAVLENNLREAVGRADDENIANLPAYCAYLYNEAPADCSGSPDKVRSWIAKFDEAYQSLDEINAEELLCFDRDMARGINP